MPDDRTQDALDALAHLFLTGLEPKVDAVGPRGVPSGSPAPASRAAPPSTGSGLIDSVLDGPPPMRMGPKITPARPSPAPQPHAPVIPGAAPFGDAAALDEDDFPPGDTRGAAQDLMADGLMSDDGLVEVPDAPAETPYLRLRRDEMIDDEAGHDVEEVDLAPSARSIPGQNGAGAQASAQAAAPDADEEASEDAGKSTDHEPTPVLVEAALLGNLPGMSGPWLIQYAHLLAQQEGPVALLHVDDTGIDLEIVEDPAASRSRPAIAESSDLIAVLTALIEAEVNPLRTILVHHDATTEPAGLARLLSIDQWTFLCGADDMAVVGVYRTLKQMVEAAPADARAENKRVGLMVMGSEASTGRAAARRVQSAASNYLKTPVQLVGIQKRMQPVRVRQGGTFDGLAALWPRLEAFFKRLTPLSTPPLVTEDETLPEAPVHPPQPQATSAALETPQPLVTADRAEMSPPRSPVPPPAAASPVAGEPPAASDEPDLLRLVAPGAIPGGIALQARCPRHPQTQLVLDQAGCLHLLRRHTSPAGRDTASSHPADFASLQAAVVDLLEARRWIREHHELLALTQRQLRFDDKAQPRLHLFTCRADLATGLIARLGDTLKLHLLQQVHVGDRSTWFCTPLS